MTMDKVQRAILENQIILAEALWMLLHSQGISSAAMLGTVSARIQQTRELLEEHGEGNPAQAAKERALQRAASAGLQEPGKPR
jgi:hypothetical protein